MFGVWTVSCSFIYVVWFPLFPQRKLLLSVCYVSTSSWVRTVSQFCLAARLFVAPFRSPQCLVVQLGITRAEQQARGEK